MKARTFYGWFLLANRLFALEDFIANVLYKQAKPY